MSALVAVSGASVYHVSRQAATAPEGGGVVEGVSVATGCAVLSQAAVEPSLHKSTRQQEAYGEEMKGRLPDSAELSGRSFRESEMGHVDL